MADENKIEDLPDAAVDAGDIKEYEKPEPAPVNPSIIMLPGKTTTTNKTYLRKTINIKKPAAPRVPKAISILPKLLPQERKTNELDDLFEVPQEEDNDINTDDLLEAPNESFSIDKNIDDLTVVPDELLAGPENKDEDMYTDDLVEIPKDMFDTGLEKPKQKPKKFTRTNKSFTSPTSVGGIQ